MKFNVLILIALLCEVGLTGRRVKRHLVFEKGSRLFTFRLSSQLKASSVFKSQKLRTNITNNSLENPDLCQFSINVRDNLFRYSDFFAHVFGFKIDWDLPDSIIHSNKKRLQRRDLYQELENVLHHYKYNSSSCIQKFVCEASTLLPRNKHFLAQLYEIMLLPNDEGITSMTHSQKECQAMFETCPLSLAGSLLMGHLKSDC